MNASSFSFPVTAAVILAAALSTPCRAAITVHWNIDQWETHATCPTPQITPGYTDLLNLSLGWGASQPVLDALNTSYPSWDGSPATYSFSPSQLNGDLYIDWYKAYDTHYSWDAGKQKWVPDPNGPLCKHGAQITVHYVSLPGGGDPEHIDFIQLYTETGDSGHAVNAVDPQPRNDDLPFYFTAADNRDNFTYVDGLPGVVFGDTPGDGHLEALTASGSVTFRLFLASWTTDIHNVTLHEQLTWGYRWACPDSLGFCSSIAGMLILLGAHLWTQRRQKGAAPAR